MLRASKGEGDDTGEHIPDPGAPVPQGTGKGRKRGKEGLCRSREGKAIAEMTVLGRTDGSGLRVGQRWQI